MNTIREFLSAPRQSTATKPKFGLVVQGGGMRGVYSAGAMRALDKAGLSNVFDVVIGSSAGAINGAYLITRQTDESVRGYVEDLSNKRFINFCRLGKIVDIDYMIEHVVKGTQLLNVDALRESLSTLYIIVTDAHTGAAVTISSKDPNTDIFEALRASAALPVLYNRTVKINGHKFVDGGVADSVPLLYSLKTECTHVVVALTNALERRRLANGLLYRTLIKLMIPERNEALRRRLLEEDRVFYTAMEIFEGKHTPKQKVKIGFIYPSNPNRMVSRTTADRRKLQDAANLGFYDMNEFLLRTSWPIVTLSDEDECL